MYGAIRGMMARLDPYSTFFTPRRYQKLREDTEGEFGGVGISLAVTLPDQPGADPYLVVARVLPGSPAARAGILPEDRLLTVAGVPVVARNHAIDAERWNSRLRGPSGTRVTIELARSSWPGSRTFELFRQYIKVPTVEWRAVERGIGYIAVKKFQEATAADVEAALRALVPNQLSALILDLRGNPGGILAQAVRVTDLFLTDGVIVKIRNGRSDRVEREVAHKPGTWSNMRLAVLIDQGTASAAEIVAGALQDHKRAVILGTPSFGKGSIQTFLDLPDGSGLKLTTARYYTPLDRSLEHAGIIPDIEIEAFEPEVIVAGQEVSGEAIEDDDEEHGSNNNGGAGDVDSSQERSLEERLRDDRQFQITLRTVQQWLGPTNRSINDPDERKRNPR